MRSASRSIACIFGAAAVLLAGGGARTDGRPALVRFLEQHAFGSAYLYSVHHEPIRSDGFIVRTTNAVPSEAEEERIDRAARTSGIDIGRFHGGPSDAIDAAVLADTTHRFVITVQNPKGSGGRTLSVMHYTSVLPKAIPVRRLPWPTLAGIGIGSSAADVFHRFGEPYAIAKIGSRAAGAARKHAFERPSWFVKDLGDGIYYYAGAVPNTAQSCVRTFGIVMQARRVSGMLDSVEC